MDEYDFLEEPPPFERSIVPAKPRRKRGPFAGWAGRPSSAPPQPPIPGLGTDLGTVTRRRSRTGIALVIAGSAIVLAQGWMLYQTRADLENVSGRLNEARNSLGLLWESTKRFDEDHMARVAALTDSIRRVFDYAQGEVRLWEASFTNLGQRVDGNDAAIQKMTNSMRGVSTRLENFARATQVQRSQIDALERSDRTRGSAVEALSRRTISQEASMNGVGSSVAMLRETLLKLDDGLESLQHRIQASSSQYGQLGRRVESLTGWADGFRRAGLSADAVQGQLSALSDELRRIRVRVDSLRPSGSRAAYSSESRSGSRSSYRSNNR